MLAASAHPKESKDSKQTEGHVAFKSDTTIILNVPAGKSSITSPNEITLQKPQKGFTCYYYAYNLLRPRFGNKVEPLETLLTNQNTDQEVQEFLNVRKRKVLTDGDVNAIFKANKKDRAVAVLLERRRAEKILSDHRKKVTFYTELPMLGKEMLRIMKEKHENQDEKITNETLRKYRDELSSVISVQAVIVFGTFAFQRINPTPIKIVLKFIEILNWYLNQDAFSTFTDCIDESHVKFNIAMSAAKTAIKLGFPETVSAAFTGDNVNGNTDALIQVFSSMYYGLSFSEWKPSDKIDRLMSELNKNGSLIMRGYFGVPFFSQKAQKINIDHVPENYEVYQTSHGKVAPDEYWQHYIVVVGVQKNLEKPDQDVVYFMDPNDSSYPTGPRKIYTMSYHDLCQRVVFAEGNDYAMYSHTNAKVFVEYYKDAVTRLDNTKTADQKSVPKIA